MHPRAPGMGPTTACSLHNGHGCRSMVIIIQWQLSPTHQCTTRLIWHQHSETTATATAAAAGLTLVLPCTRRRGCEQPRLVHNAYGFGSLAVGEACEDLRCLFPMTGDPSPSRVTHFEARRSKLEVPGSARRTRDARWAFCHVRAFLVIYSLAVDPPDCRLPTAGTQTLNPGPSPEEGGF